MGRFRRITTHLLLLALFCAAWFIATPPSLIKPAFAAPPCVALPVTTVGNASVLAQNEYQLTPDLNSQAGAIWGNTQIDLSQPFFYEFEVYLGNRSNGADGMVFMLQRQSQTAIGIVGGGLGAGGITPSFGVEFDTYRNTGTQGGRSYNDPAFDHTAIWRDGDESHATNVIVAPIQLGSGNIKDDQYHVVRFTWNPSSQNFRYFFDGTQMASITRDIINLDFAGQSLVYFGFTASTGGQTNSHRVCNKGQGNGSIIADIGVTVTDGITNIPQGGSTTYTVVVSNNGPSDVTNLSVVSNLPAEFSSMSWTATGTSGTTFPASGTGAINTATMGIPANGSVTFTVSGTLNAGATGSVSYTVNTTVPGGTSDPVSTNNGATDTDNIIAPSNTPTNTPTNTLTPSNTPSLTPSNTPTNTLTPSLTPSNTPTHTFTPSNTPTNTPTATNTTVPPRPDTIGVYNSNGVWTLRNTNNAGAPDIVAVFGGDPSDLPVTGDWNGDGVDTIGLFRTGIGRFFLSDSNTSPDVTYTFLFGNPGDAPFAGRWDNTINRSGVGVYRPSNGVMYQANDLVTGFSNYFAIYGNPGDKPVAGDWNGDNFDSIGVYRSADVSWHLTNNNTPNGVVFGDFDFVWDIWTNAPVVGDWDGNVTSTVAYFTFDGNFALHSTNATIGTDNVFAFGPPNGKPVSGKWIPQGGSSAIRNVVMPVGAGGATGGNSGDGADNTD